jgi:hypothetical protein
VGNGLGYEDSFQVDYQVNVPAGGAFVNLSNAGSHGSVFSTNHGTICANVYVWRPDQQLAACCSCPITANEVVSLTGADLANNPLTPGVPSNFSVKIIWTTPVTDSTCNAAAPINPAISGRPGPLADLEVDNSPSTGRFATGGQAWSVKNHYTAATTPGTTPTAGGSNMTETKFASKPLSISEFNANATIGCFFIQNQGSGAGICKSCRLGALGANGATN